MGGSSRSPAQPGRVKPQREGEQAIWPVYEFRPHPAHTGSTVLRYAEGAWQPDDGEFDIAFVSYGGGAAPFGLSVDLHYQRNIVWSGLVGSWRSSDRDHPRGNPWHYMLRDGEAEWGGPWAERNAHPNERAGREAMSKCCSLNRCANGRGPRFEIGDPYIAAGLLRERETKRLVTFPEKPVCMYCGDAWARKIAAAAQPPDPQSERASSREEP